MIPVRLAFPSRRSEALRTSRSRLLEAAAGIFLLPFGTAAAVTGEDASVFPEGFRPPDSALELAPDAQKRAKVFSLYYEGLSLERTGKIDGALDAYEKAFREAPQQQRLAYRASELAGQFREIDRGLRILEENYQRNPGDPEAFLHFADYLSTFHENRKERLDRALLILREASDKFPQDPRVCDQLIQALLLRQETEQAQAALDKAMVQQTSRPDYWLHLARIASRLHRLEKGTGNPVVNSLYEKAFQLSDCSVQIGSQIGEFYRRTEQYQRARDVYQKIIARHPEELEVREKLAGIYTLLGDEDMMLATLLDLERINPLRLETQKIIAQIYLKRSEWAKSVEHYLKAFRISQGTAKEYQVVAKMLCMVKRPKEAVDLLKRARFHYPDELELLVELAVCHNAADDYTTALKTFQDAEKLAEKLRPDLLNDAFYFSYGAAAERTKKFAEAEELFRKSIKLAPEDTLPARAASPYNYLGYMWLEQDKNIEEAGELIRRANELNPGQVAYVDSLGWYFFKAGNFPKAVQALLEAERLLAEQKATEPEEEDDPGNAVIYDHIAQAFFKLGHKQRALDYLQKAVDLDAANPEYQARLKQFQDAKGLVPTPLDFLDKPRSEPEEKLEETKPSAKQPPAPAKPEPGPPDPP